jgi:hypothetical protein
MTWNTWDYETNFNLSHPSWYKDIFDQWIIKIMPATIWNVTPWSLVGTNVSDLIIRVEHTILPWRWRHQVPPKHWHVSIYSASGRLIFIVTFVVTSELNVRRNQKGHSESCSVQNILYAFCLDILSFSLLSANGHSYEAVLIKIVYGVFLLILLHMLPLLSLRVMNQMTLDKEDNYEVRP